MQLGDNAPDIAAENFVEICVAEATIEEQYFESESKIQLSFFLIKLLNEFKHQEISNAVDAQRSGFLPTPNDGTPIGAIEEE